MKNIKSLSEQDLDNYLSKYRFKTEPFYHQKASLVFAQDKDRVTFWHGIGTGKSLCSTYTAKMWKCNRILVVSPTSVITTWQDEINKHTNWTFAALTGTTKERYNKFINNNAKVNCINWEGLKYLFCKKGDDGFELDQSRFIHMNYDCLILDESHKVKDYKALQSKICKVLSQLVDKCIMLTGSPIAGNELDLWNQYDVLDNGKTLGKNFFAYRNKYFKPIKHRTRRRGWTEWKLKSLDHRKEILDRLSKSTLRFDISECVDLPEMSYIKRYVKLTKKQQKFIDDITTGIDLEDVSLGENTYNKAMKISQITGGTVLDEDGECFVFKTSPKLKELQDILMEMDEKVIVFHSYVQEGREIEEMCRKNKWEYASLRSEIKDKSKEIKKFQDDPGCKILIAHPASGGIGLNLQMARVAIFYSVGFMGNLTRQQAEGRIKRVGQTKNCLFIDIVAEGSIDEHLLESLENKKEVMDAILSYLANL